MSQNSPITPGGHIHIAFPCTPNEQLPPFMHIDLPSGEHLSENFGFTEDLHEQNHAL